MRRGLPTLAWTSSWLKVEKLVAIWSVKRHSWRFFRPW
jgi:hypothetical protein